MLDLLRLVAVCVLLVVGIVLFPLAPMMFGDSHDDAPVMISTDVPPTPACAMFCDDGGVR
ncbi:hypothetical protein ACFWU5_18930 [Nocardia sp. NPDC058640]|uniref:hypothetical protein n=1 Tax=Nocardia sp. NPDC058640 TaxID=3346571 RepID=UPI003665357F